MCKTGHEIKGRTPHLGSAPFEKLKKGNEVNCRAHSRWAAATHSVCCLLWMGPRGELQPASPTTAVAGIAPEAPASVVDLAAAARVCLKSRRLYRSSREPMSTHIALVTRERRKG